MKKLLLFPFILLVFACSSDEMSNDGNTSDPVIGRWTASNRSCGNPDIEQRIYFNSNGNFYEEYDDGSICTENSCSGTWTNNGNDFDSKSQTYQLLYDAVNEFDNADIIYLRMNFSSDFNKAEFNVDGCTGTLTKG